MKGFTLVLAVAAMAVAATTPANANVPKGGGLELLEAPIPLVCTGDHETFDVIVTPGNGATGWRVDVDGQEVNQHHVLSYFAIIVDGTTVASKYWGVKQGLVSYDCTQTIGDTVVEGTIYPLPGNSNG